MTVDKSKTMMDVINDVATALGFTFFVAEPVDGPVGNGQPNDLSIGVPIFRRPTVLADQRSLPIMLHDKQLLTDLKPKHDTKDERYVIRARGTINKKVGRSLGGDTFKRVTFTYWPPWIKNAAGVIKQLTHYDIGTANVLGYQTPQQCEVACLLIAIQIALSRDTGVAQCPGQPGFGIDSFAFIADSGSGITSRMYVTNRKSVMRLGGDGTSQQKSPYGTSASSQNELLWSTEIGGSLVDNPEFEKIVKDYTTAISGGKVFSWSPTGFD